MDRTSIIVIVACLILIGLWTTVLTPKLFPPKPLPAGATNAAAGSFTNQIGANQLAGTDGAVKIEETVSAAQPITNAIIPEQVLQVTQDQVRYVFSSHGGGVKEIDLLGYPETISTRRQKTPETNRVATLNRFSPAPSMAVLGGEGIRGRKIFYACQ